MRSFVLCWLLVLTQPVLAQTSPFDIWHKGKVVLVGWDTLKGLVKYNQENLLHIMRDGKIEVHYSPKVVSFEIQDQSHKRVRQFYSLPYGETEPKNYVFFELISYGKQTVLSRETVIARTLSQGSVMAPPKIDWVIKEKYFLWDKHESIVAFRGRRKEWLELFITQATKVQDYAKENKLDFDNKYQLKQIIDFYNSLYTP